MIDPATARPAGARTLSELIVIDLDIVARNVRRWQQRCYRPGRANRPHIKTPIMCAR